MKIKYFLTFFTENKNLALFNKNMGKFRIDWPIMRFVGTLDFLTNDSYD